MLSINKVTPAVLSPSPPTSFFLSFFFYNLFFFLFFLYDVWVNGHVSKVVWPLGAWELSLPAIPPSVSL